MDTTGGPDRRPGGVPTTARYERFIERYSQADVPWDDPLPPPEIMALAGDMPSGKALDLGCGFGRAAIWLAQRGWEVDAVDYVEVALSEARSRAVAAAAAVRFHLADVTDLGFLAGPYDLAVDVGTLHNVEPERRRGYAAELARLLAAGGRLVAFVRLARPGDPPDKGISRGEILRTLAAFQIERIDEGESAFGGTADWPSAWVYARKVPGAPA